MIFTGSGIAYADFSENWYEAGKNLYNQSKYNEALAVFEQGLATDSDNADGWNGKGNVLFKLEEYDLAVEAYDQAIDIDPNLLKAWINKGNALFKLEKYALAVQSYDQVLAMDPDLEEVKISRDKVLQELNKTEMDSDKNLIYANITGNEKSSESADDWITKGDAFIMEGRYDEALQAYDQALQIDEDNGLAKTLREISLMGKSDPEEAWNQYVFNAIILLGKYDAAIVVCDQALQSDPENADAWKLKGDAFVIQGMYENAMEAYDNALKINPEYVEALSGRKIAAENLNNPTKALKDEGNVLFLIGDYTGALKKYDEALKINPYDTKGWMFKGNLLSMLGRDAEAAQAYDQALRISPVNVSVPADHNANRAISFNPYASGTSMVNKSVDRSVIAMEGGTPGNTREFAGPAALKGVLKWKFATNNALRFGIKTPVEADGIVYVGSRGQNFSALDASSGEELGKLETIDNVFSSAVVINDTVYVSSDMYVCGFDTTSGMKRWKYDVKSSWWRDASQPIVADDMVFCYSHNHNISALDKLTGTLKWIIPVQSYCLPVEENGTVYFVNDSHSIIALEAETGVTQWEYLHNKTIDSEICLANGIVYFVEGTSLNALDTSKGTLIWKFDPGYSVDTPAIADGVVYAGCYDTNIYALDADTGTQIWKYATGDVEEGVKSWKAPAVAGGIVYACSDDKNLYAIKTDTGTLLWKYELPDSFSSSPAVFDGVVYVGCDDGYVYAIE